MVVNDQVSNLLPTGIHHKSGNSAWSESRRDPDTRVLDLSSLKEFPPVDRAVRSSSSER